MSATPRPVDGLSDLEVLMEFDELAKSFTDEDFHRLESELMLRAAVLGWTGDPLRQPARSVLAAARATKGGA